MGKRKLQLVVSPGYGLPHTRLNRKQGPFPWTPSGGHRVPEDKSHVAQLGFNWL